MLGDDRGGRRLVPTQSVSRVGVWDRLHLGSVALELRRTIAQRRRCCIVTSISEAILVAVPNGGADEKHAGGARGHAPFLCMELVFRFRSTIRISATSFVLGLKNEAMIWRISLRNSIIKWQGYRVSASRLAESNFRYTQPPIRSRKSNRVSQPNLGEPSRARAARYVAALRLFDKPLLPTPSSQRIGIACRFW